MKRRLLLLGAVSITLVVVGIAARLQQQQQAKSHPVLDRAFQSGEHSAPVAVLLEFGIKDRKSKDWSGAAKVNGAKVLRRDGYRFRQNDKLIKPSKWTARSYRALRLGSRRAILDKLEGPATVGVVYHLQDVQKDAEIVVNVKDRGQATIKLNAVLSGKRVPMFQGQAVARLVSAALPVATGPTEDDCPAATYGPDGTLWIAYTSYGLRDSSRTIQQQRYKKQPKNFKNLYHPEYSEQVFVRSYRDGKWSPPVAVTDNRQDIARLAVAVTKDNLVWVVYSAQRNNNFDLYARSLGSKNAGKKGIGNEILLTRNKGADLSPAACVAANGDIWVAYHYWDAEGNSGIGTIVNENGKWESHQKQTLQNSTAWAPSIAASPNGDVSVGCDYYSQTSGYDILVSTFSSKDAKPVTSTVVATKYFEARPALTYDTHGRLWIAYEHGPPKWGKDYGALDSKDGHPLYDGRTVRVLCRKENRTGWFSPVALLPALNASPPQLPFDGIKTNKYERHPRYAYPKIGIDGKGRVWLTYRRNFGCRYSSHPGAYWITFARRLDGEQWSPEIELSHSDGLLDHRPALLPHVSGGIVVAHNTDGRYTTPNTIDNQIYLSFVNLDRKSTPPVFGKKRQNPGKGEFDVGLGVDKDVARIRKYRVHHKGEELKLLRGEYHRHTEISWDGEADGSLEDMFRYAIDAADFDWIGNGDHDNGAGREYPWYLTQKFNDAYLVVGHFTPMHTYERSVSYPHGHRNVMFAKRGVMTLPRLAPPQKRPKGVRRWPGGVHPDDTKMLYRYLHEMGGICAVHTSATGMGTDWRDNDPKAEPIVEIYQGDRMSYEHPGAPRAGYDPQLKRFPTNIGGWYPKGFVDLALEKGYRLGFQASSDHWSTHISYFVVLAPKNDRKSILEAVKKRHVYGATDNIILDVRSGDYLMGDEFTTTKAPKISFTVIGTDKLQKVDVMKDSTPVKTFRPKGTKFEGEWTDPRGTGNTHYYYVRVVQENDEVAWSSPMWIKQKK
ncbi:MAG: hypothetical protein ACFCD0_24485 [Gemmataceae bacterium]